MSPPIVCGHRGAPAVSPENTLASFAAAQDRGATWVEFDVRPSADGSLVLHHDPDTAIGQHIGTTDYSELDASIPRFGDLPAALPELGLDIEMKTDGIGISLDAFADLVISEIDTHCRSLENLIVTSFDAEVLALVRNRRSDIPTGLLFHDKSVDWAIETATEAGHGTIAPWIPLVTSDLVDKARAASLGIATWTVNKPEQIRTAVQLGVDMIIGDDPAVIIEHLDAGPQT